jgi:hypothetical protein
MRIIGVLITLVGLSFFANAQTKSISKSQAESETQLKKERINDLKLEVLNAKAQMTILKHLIRNEGVSKTYPKIKISFKNEMSDRYILHSVKYSIDGEDVYSYFRDEESKTDTDKVGKNSIPDFEGSVAPGSHNLVIRVLFQGNDTGIFSYISDYKTKAEGQLTFQVDKGTTTAIEVNSFEKGWMLTEFKDRPDLRVRLNGSLTDKFVRF